MQGGSCILIWGHFGSMCHLFQTTKNTDINIEEEDSQSYSCVQATSSHSWGVTKPQWPILWASPHQHYFSVASSNCSHPSAMTMETPRASYWSSIRSQRQDRPPWGGCSSVSEVSWPINYFFFRELIAEWTAVKNITHYNEGFSSKHLTESRRVRDILCSSLGL